MVTLEIEWISTSSIITTKEKIALRQKVSLEMIMVILNACYFFLILEELLSSLKNIDLFVYFANEVNLRSTMKAVELLTLKYFLVNPSCVRVICKKESIKLQ